MANERLVDKRTIERNINKGLLSEAEFQKYLTALPDVASKSVLVDYGEETDEDDGDDED